VVLCWIPFIGWIGMIAALVALALAIVALRKGEKGLGLAGLVLGIVGLAWGGWEQVMALRMFDDAVEVVSGSEQAPAEDASAPERALHPEL
jgi:hypothetical protein